MLQADAGTIHYDNKEVRAPHPRQMREDGVSVVYQHPALAPDLTVLENLQLAAPSLAAPGGPAEAEHILARIATDELRMPVNTRVAELSLAQRHIVEIASALATHPTVLFLDEPTEPLQHADVRKLFDLIGELKRAGVGIVYVSHRLHEVDELADRISVMRDGEIIDSRLARSITPAEIVALIAGRPLGQIFPAKAKSVGAPLFAVRGLSGRGFDQVDLVVHAGEIVGLAGIEGEGQREFIRAAAGIDRRRGGEVRINNTRIAGDTPGAFRKSGIGFIPDDRHAEGVFLNLTLRENLSLGFLGAISNFGVVDRSGEAERAKKITENLRIRAASVESKLFELSGGNQQKVLFGREISAQPNVLLVDEPTKGVDIGARSDIYQRLRAVADQGLASAGIVVGRHRTRRPLRSGADLCARPRRRRIIGRRGHRRRHHRGQSHHHGFARERSARERTPSARAQIPVGRPFSRLGAGRPHRHHSRRDPCFEWLLPVAVFHQEHAVFFSILAFLSSAQLATVLVGAIDLSIGPLAGLCVVLASFLAPDGVEALPLAVGVIAILVFTTLFGLLQGLLITSLRLPAIVVTIATFIGSAGAFAVVAADRGRPDRRRVSDAAQFPIGVLPAGLVPTLAMVVVAEWLLFRTGSADASARSARARLRASARHRQPAPDLARFRHLGL